jgi:hypothetical protein
MTNLKRHTADAFSRFKPSPVVKAAMDYSDPTICPYCKKPMKITKIAKADGFVEEVYLCPEDRAVGVVPDAEDVMTTFPIGDKL